MSDAPPTAYLVIFGAAVRADGSPSGSLTRRVEAALARGRRTPGAIYLPTGGVGRYGAAEGQVMRDLLLAAGVSNEAILVEDQARDTLQSVRLCHRLLRGRPGRQRIVVCTSPYHAPRCALLFTLLGYPVTTALAIGDRQALGWAKWLRYAGKELIALPFDAIMLIIGAIGDRLAA